MRSSDLVVGHWYRSPSARGMVFRYEGQGLSGAYVFSKFKAATPSEAGVVATTIEIWNLDALEPWPEVI